jgi:hypothetical protein
MFILSAAAVALQPTALYSCSLVILVALALALTALPSCSQVGVIRLRVMLIAVSCWWLVVSLMRDSHNSTIRMSSSSVGVARGVGSAVIVVAWACVVSLVHTRESRVRVDSLAPAAGAWVKSVGGLKPPGRLGGSVNGVPLKLGVNVELKAAAAVRGSAGGAYIVRSAADRCALASTASLRHGPSLAAAAATGAGAGPMCGGGDVAVPMNPLFQARAVRVGILTA